MPRQAAGTRTTAAQRQIVRDFGTCLRFDGSGDYVLITNDAVNLSVFTYTAWVYLATAKSHTVKGDSKGSGNPRAPKIQIDSSGTVFLLEQGIAIIGSSTTKVPLRRWTHIAVSYSVTGAYVIYINGTAAGSGTNLRTLGFADTYIGASPDAGEDFNGKIDDFRIYNTVLSATDIQNLYYGIEPSTATFAWYKFDEGSGSTANDSSGNGYSGTITNATYSTEVFIKSRSASGTRSAVT